MLNNAGDFIYNFGCFVSLISKISILTLKHSSTFAICKHARTIPQGMNTLRLASDPGFELHFPDERLV